MENRNIKRKMGYLGLKVNYKVFLIIRLISSLILFFLVLLLCKYGFILAPICTLIYFFTIEYIIIDRSISLRKAELESDALEFFPIFLLSLKDGRNVKKALQVSTSIVDNKLSTEFKKALNEIEIGKSVEEVLVQMKRYIPSDSINNIVSSIVEVNRVGSNINDSVNLQLDYILQKNRKKIVNRYKSVPLIMAIYSIIFVLIVLFILIFFNIFK